jgi:hypothetical protein
MIVRKVKQIKEKEEKDSLFNEIKFKSQSAMEYLMTYGWAILIIALTLAVLYSLGIMNPKNFIPRAPPGSCFVFRPNGPGTTDFISLQGTCGYLPMYVGSFNGVDGQIIVPYNSGFNILTTNQLSVELWFYQRASSSSCKLIGSSNWMLYPLDSTKQIRVMVLGADGSWRWGSPYYYNFNQWYHIVGIIKILNGNLTTELWVNGVKIVQNNFGNVTPSSTTSALVIGSRWISYFNGSIANVQIYNTALSQQEIQYLYQQGLGGGPVRLQNLVGWWPLNGDAKDYSGNNNHGTINGGVTFVQNYNPP